MNYASAPIAADLGLNESLTDAMRRAAVALQAALARRKARRAEIRSVRHDYERMLGNEDMLRDAGVSREEVYRALAGCGRNG
ncbi:MAG: hypothetical protein U1E59_04935 [Amaricoccus sp.]